MKRLLPILIGLALLLSLSACGGGGGGNSSPAVSPDTNWGQLTWDQDNWS